MTGSRLPAWTAIGIGLVSIFVAACSGRGGPGSAFVPPPAPAVASADLHDRGPRAASAPVEAGILLRLNHRAQLDRLIEQISNPRSSRYHRFLTPQQFDEHFAPTAAEQQAVTSALRRAGFSIVRTYRTGTLIVARASAATAERFFHTTIHDFDQNGYGRRYANVTAIRVPRELGPSILGVELSSVVLNHAGPTILRSHPQNPTSAPLPAATGHNVVRNPGFESGKLKPWVACGAGTPFEATISTLHPHSGTFDAMTGSPSHTSGEPKGRTGICQTVTIPPNATLTAYLYRVTNDNSGHGVQIVALYTTGGKLVAEVEKTHANHPHWSLVTSASLARFAGRDLVLFFGVDGNGNSKHFVTQFVDDVALTSVPSPSPTPTPTPTPIAPGPGSPIAGPTYGPDSFNGKAGWGPRAVADGFGFPVQDGYNGTGVTAAVVIDGTINASDLAGYKTEYQVTQTGTITTEPVASATPYGYDPLETSLDVETITGLAPGANIVIYDAPDLSNLHTEEAYAQLLSDEATAGKPHASVVNSSFDECESEDTVYDADVDQDAVNGAAIGVTFVAASGDWGATCFMGPSHPFGVNVPAAAPHVLAVGGNESDSSVPPSGTTGIADTVAWQNCTAGFNANYCSSGGGVSTIYSPLPSYQVGVSGIASTTSRNVPDIAFPAVFDDIYYSGNTGSYSYAPGFHGLIVGTSWASPIAVSLLTETVQICGPVGWVNPAIYAVFSSYGEVPYFIDLTSGSNVGFKGYTQGYNAQPGYDNVTGIGMPNGVTFAAALCAKK